MSAFIADGHQVTLAVDPSWLGTSEYTEHILPLDGQFEVASWKASSSNGVIDRGSVLGEIRRLSESATIDHVFFPTLDGYAPLMGVDRLRARRSIARGKTSEAVLLRASKHYPSVSVSKWLIARGSWWLTDVSPLHQLSFMDPVVNGWINASTKRHDRWQVIADPVEVPDRISKADARRRLGIPDEGRYIIGMGYMDKRKGIDLLVRAFLRAKLAPNDRLALIGPQDEGVSSLIRQECTELIRSGRIVVINRFMTNEEFAWCFSAADVVAATYSRHIGSASMVIRAAAAQRPTLGSTFGWIGRTINQFGLGWACDVENSDDLAASITQSIENAETWKYSEQVAAYTRYNSIQNYQAGAVRFVRRLNGLPPHPGQITWNQLEAQTALGDARMPSHR